jgi:hypothetical protein
LILYATLTLPLIRAGGERKTAFAICRGFQN